MTIKQIQHLLAFLGYYTLAVDGIWGDGSEQACREFQEDFGGIGVDGIPGVETQKALRHAVAFGLPEREDKPAQPPAGGVDWPDCPNFTKTEFACKCGCGFDDAAHELVQNCQKVRDHFDAPFIISSGCRCKAHNARVGGVYNSRHLLGHAVDFRIRGHSAAEVDAYVATLPGIVYHYCIDGDYVHMDIGG